MANCPKCGTPVEADARFCPECGSMISAVPEAPVVQAPPVEAAVPIIPAVPAEPPRPVYQQYPPQYQQSYQPQYQQYTDPNYQNSYQQPSGAPPIWNQPRQPVGPTIRGVYSRALGVLSRKPLRLWGLSLMCSLLIGLATIFGVLPIISLPITFVLSVGMSAIYLDGIRCKEVNSDQLFSGFKSFFRFAGGMGWMYLWILIWGLIPVAGIFMAIIKAYSYRFTPYILLNDPNISATQALRRSMELTGGFKGRMFGADIFIVLAVYIVMGLLLLLSRIAYIGIIFTVIGAVWSLLIAAFLPLLMGLIQAAFYDEIEKLR